MPYAAPKGNSIIKTMKNSLKHILPNNVKTRVTYSGQKLSTKLQIKDKAKDQQKDNLVYYARKDILKYIKKKHGQDIVTVIWSLEKLQTRFLKVSADICYIKMYKKEQLIPTFARVNVLKYVSFKLRKKIPTLIM